MGGFPTLHGRSAPSCPLAAAVAHRYPARVPRRRPRRWRRYLPSWRVVRWIVLPVAGPRRPRRRGRGRRRVRVLADGPAAGQGSGGIHPERRQPRLRGRRRVHHRVPGREAHLRAAPADPADAPQRDHRGGGRALLLALRGRRPRASRRAAYANFRHGRVVEGGSTITQQLAKVLFLTPGPELLPQGQGGPARVRAREALLEGPPPRALPEPGLHGPRRLRRRGGGADVLRQVGPGPHAARGGDARRAAALAGQLLALRAPRAGAAAAGDRGRPPAGARVHHRGRRRRRPTARRSAWSRPSAGAAAASTSSSTSSRASRRSTGATSSTRAGSPSTRPSTGDPAGGGAGPPRRSPGAGRAPGRARRRPGQGRAGPRGARGGGGGDRGRTTGYVKALVGGVDFARTEFNRALHAHRQPGSAFKPFVYLAALETGHQPTEVLDDSPVALRVRRARSGRPRTTTASSAARSRSSRPSRSRSTCRPSGSSSRSA